MSSAVAAPSSGLSVLLALLLAAATIQAVMATSEWEKHRQTVRSVFARAKTEHCRSELLASKQARRQCFEACRQSSQEGQQLVLRTANSWFTCRLRCFHRFRLVARYSADAYDRLVAAVGCDAKSGYVEQLQCRTGCLQKVAANATVDTSQMDRLQLYAITVCETICGRNYAAGSGALDSCKTMCRLAQVMESDAFKKLSDCLAGSCTGKTGASLTECKAACLKEC